MRWGQQRQQYGTTWDTGKDYDNNENEISDIERLALGPARMTRRMRPTRSTGSCLANRSIDHNIFAKNDSLLFIKDFFPSDSGQKTIEEKMEKLMKIMHQADSYYHDGHRYIGREHR